MIIRMISCDRADRYSGPKEAGFLSVDVSRTMARRRLLLPRIPRHAPALYFPVAVLTVPLRPDFNQLH
jgi:hypothetical protein